MFHKRSLSKDHTSPARWSALVMHECTYTKQIVKIRLGSSLKSILLFYLLQQPIVIIMISYIFNLSMAFFNLSINNHKLLYNTAHEIDNCICLQSFIS